MLNISHNKVQDRIQLQDFASGMHVSRKAKHNKWFNRFLKLFALLAIIVLFLPWTQNITASGQVTTLKPDQRPQTIQSPIPGRIESWFVQEGDYVKKGDTILRISEIKSIYFDSLLVERTGDQINAKSASATAYGNKVSALERQIAALQNERSLKQEQLRNKRIQTLLKVESDSMDWVAAKTNSTIAKRQLDRTQTLYDEGLKALKDVEAKRLKYQETQAKELSTENKFYATKNALINAEIELSRIVATYDDKISKVQSSLHTATSNQLDTKAQISKLENVQANYQERRRLQFVVAPQDGFINKALRSGIGETFKEGESLLSIMPAIYDLAVETYVKPLDLPLLHIGEKVRVQFDGWPAIVFNGWPNASYGTYGAKVVAIENFISPNGKYRVLLAPDTADHQWPQALRVGSGAKTIALLEDVPIWFELWRQLNGFPPNYYQPEGTATDKPKKS